MNEQLSFLQQLRLEELGEAVRDRQPGARLLEIGAGAGWQAMELARWGFDVAAVDVPDSNYSSARVWPVIEYDGRSLPFPSEEFDLIFSSNVLEHVEDLPALLDDMWRVLKPGGRMIHVVPSASWRLWTSLTYYPHVGTRLLGNGATARQHPDLGHGMDSSPSSGRRTLADKIFSPVHGTATGAFKELLAFRRQAWFKVLRRVPASSLQCRPNRLFYSGYSLSGRFLPIRLRKTLSYGLGSSCHIFTLKKEARPAA